MAVGDRTFAGDLLVDLAAPIVLTSGWTPALDEDCVSVDPTEDIEIIVGDITDDDSYDCYGDIAIDWVKFWISDDDWTNKEYLGIDTLIPIGGDDTLSYGVHLHEPVAYRQGQGELHLGAHLGGR